MIDISDKDVVPRVATAVGEIVLRISTVQAIENKKIKKRDVFEFSRAAAFLAIKNTHNLLPHAHPIPLEDAELIFTINENRVKAECTVKAHYKTGVEMEALVGVTVALLTIWDMVKYLEKDEHGQYPVTSIKNVEVTKKEKG